MSMRIEKESVMKTEPVITGWCPNHGVIVNKRERIGIMESIKLSRGSGSPGVSPDNLATYSHRQIGKIQIWASIIAVIIILITSFFTPEILFLLIIVVLALVCGLLLFSTLTVEVTQAGIRIAFGPVPVIRKMITFDQISDFARVESPWYYGWGVRPIRNGKLYNISGYEGVEIRLTTGKRLRIGTDDQDGLIEALVKTTGLPVSTNE